MTERLQYVVLLFPVAGIFMFIGGLLIRRRLKGKLQGCVQTNGTVIGNVAGFGGGFDTETIYRPTVEFFVGARRFSFTAEAGCGQKAKEGTKLAVMYHPANPLIAFIARDHYTPANMLLGIGGAFVGLSALAAWMI